METKHYIVVQIDGDYAYLKCLENETAEPVFIARALLPENITEGSRLKMENFLWEMMD